MLIQPYRLHLRHTLFSVVPSSLVTDFFCHKDVFLKSVASLTTAFEASLVLVALIFCDEIVVAQFRCVIIEFFVRGACQQVDAVDICESALIGGSCFHQILVVVGIVDVGYTIQILSVQRAAGLVGLRSTLAWSKPALTRSVSPAMGFASMKILPKRRSVRPLSVLFSKE